jgi:hypothetical protein
MSSASETTSSSHVSWRPAVLGHGPRENRAFLGRAVRFLAEEAGIRQFLDIGTGRPTTGNVHDVAQAVNGPETAKGPAERGPR